MSAESASEVSGPVAMIHGVPSGSGTRSISRRSTVMSGCDVIAVGHFRREPDAIDRERGAGRDACGVGGAHHQRAEPPHFFLQQADGVIQLVAAERVAAHQLGEPVGLVHERRPDRPHLEQRDGHTARSDLPGGFGAGEAAADDVNACNAMTCYAEGPPPQWLRHTRRRLARAAGAGRRRVTRARFGAPARAASNSTACSIVTASGVVPFGSDALVVPSVTYGP